MYKILAFSVSEGRKKVKVPLAKRPVKSAYVNHIRVVGVNIDVSMLGFDAGFRSHVMSHVQDMMKL